MKTLTARFPGYCTRTGARILPGDLIEWSGRGRAVLIERASARDLDSPEIRDSDVALADSIDPELAATDPDGARAAGAYLRRAMARGVSDIWSSGGREYYRNRAGLCEDAPCCGCCNA
jgi:hypothetical protein